MLKALVLLTTCASIGGCRLSVPTVVVAFTVARRERQHASLGLAGTDTRAAVWLQWSESSRPTAQVAETEPTEAGATAVADTCGGLLCDWQAAAIEAALNQVAGARSEQP